MATWGRSAHGSTAFTSVVGLLLLALTLVAFTPAWYENDPAVQPSSVATDVWAPTGWVVETSTTPPMSSPGQEHPPAHWLRHSPPEPAAPASLLVTTWPDSGAIRSPQQTAHSTAGSRSPPQA
ncbi:hypothetical protein AB0O34_30490 [Sphaerisporangium sp. NPDC088356]|uniref:hypothetical protein n=1 Tax=Sphaerisporangium sp. NPDC088356 TaxID=3154871 RepID=UPI003436DEF8